MRLLLLTVAGLSSRFNQDSGQAPVLKCLYSADAPCLLERLLRQAQAANFDRIILVGGYLFSELQQALSGALSVLSERVTLVENPLYASTGSLESLYLGLLRAEDFFPDQLTFLEGDLLVDTPSFLALADARTDVYATAPEPLLAAHSVAACVDAAGHLCYLFDPMHRLFHFPGPMRELYSSGQAWSFSDPSRLFLENRALTPSERKGTNLLLMERYFADTPEKARTRLSFSRWYNCNTPEDYHRGMRELLEVEPF